MTKEYTAYLPNGVEVEVLQERLAKNSVKIKKEFEKNTLKEVLDNIIKLIEGYQK